MIKQDLNLFLLPMIKKKNLIFLLIFFLTINCSFDDKTGIWSEDKKEKGRISQLEKEQSKIIDVTKIYSSDNIFLVDSISGLSLLYIFSFLSKSDI